MESAIFQPVVALASWSLVMWIWLYATRLPAMSRARLMRPDLVGTTGPGLRDALVAAGEQRASWKADNYNHLMEQPTLFYAVALVLALIGQGDGLNAGLAWAYTGLRIAHSLVQATVNRVVVRFVLHVIGTLALIAMTLHAAIAVF